MALLSSEVLCKTTLGLVPYRGEHGASVRRAGQRWGSEFRPVRLTLLGLLQTAALDCPQPILTAVVAACCQGLGQAPSLRTARAVRSL